MAPCIENASNFGAAFLTDQTTERVSGLGIPASVYVEIAFDRDPDGGVAEPLTHDLHRNACLRRVCIAQPV